MNTADIYNISVLQNIIIDYKNDLEITEKMNNCINQMQQVFTYNLLNTNGKCMSNRINGRYQVFYQYIEYNDNRIVFMVKRARDNNAFISAEHLY